MYDGGEEGGEEEEGSDGAPAGELPQDPRQGVGERGGA